MRDGTTQFPLYSPVHLPGIGTALLVGATEAGNGHYSRCDLNSRGDLVGNIGWKESVSRFASFLARGDPYATILADKDMLEDEIRSLSKRALLSSHPDKGGDPTRLEAVLLARRVLLDARARKAYDLHGWAGVLAVWDKGGEKGAEKKVPASNMVLIAADEKGGVHPVFESDFPFVHFTDDSLGLASKTLGVGSRSFPTSSWVGTKSFSEEQGETPLRTIEWGGETVTTGGCEVPTKAVSTARKEPFHLLNLDDASLNLRSSTRIPSLKVCTQVSSLVLALEMASTRMPRRRDKSRSSASACSN